MKWTEATTGLKETCQALREIALVVAIGAVVFWPSGVGNYLDQLAAAFHVEKASILGVSMDFANHADQAAQGLDKAADQLKSLQASGNLDSATTKSLSSILNTVETSQAQVQKVNDSVKESLATGQTAAAAPVAPTTPVSKGWIYLGKLDDHGGGNLTWQPGQPQTINAVDPAAIVPGKALTIRDDVYMHTPVAASSASTAPILGVLRANTTAVVADQLNTDSRSPDGKVRYAWVLVTPQQ